MILPIIKITNNGGLGVGTGSFIGGNIIVTAYHNLNIVTDPNALFRTTINGNDYNLEIIIHRCKGDLAFLRIIGYISPTHYIISDNPPALGDDVTMHGYVGAIGQMRLNQVDTVLLEDPQQKNGGGTIYECPLDFIGYFLEEQSYPGMSGGPVLNAAGEIVGIISGNDRFYPDPNDTVNYLPKALIVSLLN